MSDSGREVDRNYILYHIEKTPFSSRWQIARATNIKKSNVDHHIRWLCSHGIVKEISVKHKDYSRVYYKIPEDMIKICRDHKPTYYPTAFERIQELEKRGTKELSRCPKCNYLLYPEEL